MHLFSDDPCPLGPKKTSWLGGWHRTSAPQVVKTAKGMGYVRGGAPPFDERRYALQMVWTKEGDHWVGQWKWFPESHIGAIRHRADSNEAAVCGQAPPELLLAICEHALGGEPPQKTVGLFRRHLWSSYSWEDLLRLAMICRATFKVCAPSLYRALGIESGGADRFLEFLRNSAKYIPRFASRITVHGLLPWAAYLKLVRVMSSLLPHIEAVAMESPELHAHRNPAFYYPSYPHVTPLLRQTATNLRYLTLVACSFVSSRDLLHLLHSFPSVTDARIDGVVCLQISTSPKTPSFSQSGQLSTLHTRACRPLELALSMSATWACARSPSERFPGGFPGVYNIDARAMTEICRCFRSHADYKSAPSETFHLDTSPNSRSCESARYVPVHRLADSRNRDRMARSRVLSYRVPSYLSGLFTWTRPEPSASPSAIYRHTPAPARQTRAGSLWIPMAVSRT